jgi:hypothetical protein
VKRALAYPAQNSVGIEFAPTGELTTRQLIEAVQAIGLTATT